MVGEKYDRLELQNLREAYRSIEIIRWNVSIYGPFLNSDNKLISLSIYLEIFLRKSFRDMSNFILMKYSSFQVHVRNNYPKL